MSNSHYQDIYNKWQRKASKEGFTLNQFRSHYGKYVEADNKCLMTKAIGAQFAYRSLIENRNIEFKIMKKERECIRWT